MDYRRFFLYIMVGVIADVLFSTFYEVSFPLSRYILPFVIGYVLERKNPERSKPVVAPLLLIAVMVIVIVYTPLKETVALFFDSEYFVYLAGVGSGMISYILDIFISFAFGIGLAELASRMRWGPQKK